MFRTLLEVLVKKKPANQSQTANSAVIFANSAHADLI